MSKSLLAFVPALALALAGCPTTSTLQTAKTNGAGNFQAVVEPGYIGFGAQGESLRWGMLSVSGRYGVSDRVDVGGRIGTTGAEVMGKFMITDPADEGVAMSIAPSLGGFVLGAGGAGFGSVFAQVPLIIGIPVGDHQLVLAPKVHFWFIGGSTGNATGVVGVMSLGTSVGFAAKLGPNFRLMPELTVLVPTTAIGSAGGQTVTGSIPAGGVIAQASLGFMFGGRPSRTPGPRYR